MALFNKKNIDEASIRIKNEFGKWRETSRVLCNPLPLCEIGCTEEGWA